MCRKMHSTQPSPNSRRRACRHRPAHRCVARRRRCRRGGRGDDRVRRSHLLFSNAGVGAGETCSESHPEGLGLGARRNLYGVIHGVRIFTPLMLAAAAKDPAYQGHIVNTASMAGLLNPPAMGVYNVSKHAVVALSRVALPGSEPGHGAGALLGAVPVLRADRHQPDRGATARPGWPMSTAHALATGVAGVVGQGRPFRQGDGGGRGAADFRRHPRRKLLYYSHPQALETVRQRMEDIVGQRNPGDPFGDKKEVRAGLIAALRG